MITRKSRLVSLFLTVMFGPLGVFYSSMAGGLAMFLATLVFTGIFFPLGLLCWLVSIAVGDHCTYRHNQNVEYIMATMEDER